MKLAMDTAWINKDTCGKAKTAIAGTFCGVNYMDCAGNNLELEVTGFKAGGTDPCVGRRLSWLDIASRKLQASELEVDFEATSTSADGAATTQALEAAVAAVDQIKEMDTAAMSTLSAALSADISVEVGVEVEVSGVVVTKAAKQVSKVVAVPKATEAEAGGGLGAGVMSES